MNIDDFIFTDDVAESLGSRGEEADLDTRLVEIGAESHVGPTKSGFGLASVGLGLLGLIGLDRHADL
jgi:hypothetical protein